MRQRSKLYFRRRYNRSAYDRVRSSWYTPYEYLQPEFTVV